MNIYESICKVMEDVGAIGKDKKNTSGSPFMYRGVDDVMNALNPAMVKNKIFVVPEVLEQSREDRTTNRGNSIIYSICRIKYTFYAEDGSNVAAVVIGEAFDTGDKATNKAMSIAFKYACFQVFCIPTEEMQDPDAESHELAKNKDESAGNKPDNQKKEKKVSRTDLINEFNSEILRTGKSLGFFLEQAGVTEVRYIKTVKLTEFIEILKKYPDKNMEVENE